MRLVAESTVMMMRGALPLVGFFCRFSKPSHRAGHLHGGGIEYLKLVRIRRNHNDPVEPAAVLCVHNFEIECFDLRSRRDSGETENRCQNGKAVPSHSSRCVDRSTGYCLTQEYVSGEPWQWAQSLAQGPAPSHEPPGAHPQRARLHPDRAEI